MSPVTHLLASWTAADLMGFEKRDLALVSWCGVIPDIDGLVVLVDAARALLGLPPEFYYGRFHHMFCHGLPAALALSVLAAWVATRRLRVGVAALLVIHLHLLCDLAGSRGPGLDDFWPIAYLAPFSERLTFLWRGQWPLAGWQNLAITVTLLAVVFVLAVRRGVSPVSLFSQRADAAVVATLRRRFDVTGA
jgi:hypothetical protein